MLTREINIGSLKLGGKNPVRIQSMTNTQTLDTASTVEQTLALARAGCEMVRITTRNKSEALNLINIKKKLHESHCHIPLIADIHFQPQVAEIAARIVEKIRINPGNFLDKTLYLKNKSTEYNEDKYLQELENINIRLKPLLEICKNYGTAIRIGVNHGSLSERIYWKYGNTIEGLVISALEYIEIFRNHNFHNIVLSIKSSNVKIMIDAYRLLAQRMTELNFDYPIHLGVTETGAGFHARLKSAAGIGALLLDGIGNTIRVSLSENPVNEIPVAKKLVELFSSNKKNSFTPIYHFCSLSDTQNENHFFCVSTNPSSSNNKLPPDYLYNEETNELIELKTKKKINCIKLNLPILDFSSFSKKQSDTVFVCYWTDSISPAEIKTSIIKLRNNHFTNPLFVIKTYNDNHFETLSLKATGEFSYLLSERLIEGLCIKTLKKHKNTVKLMFDILQINGLRRTHAEFIACPTCGRTAFNVEKLYKWVSEKLLHLKHLKIAVMGCIVNGPGEMADADYGFVGVAPGKVNIYRKKQIVLKNIPEEKAISELIKIIKKDGIWIEP